MPRAPCGGLPSGAVFNPFQGGEGSSTGPHVPSNPMLDPNDPRAKGKTHGGSAPLVTGPQAGPYSIHSRGGRGAVRALMCPLTPCLTPTTHVPGKTHGGSAPLVMGPQAGLYSIHSRGGRGAVRAPMCPLTPCMTPLHHVPRTRRTEEARPLSWALKRGHIQSIPVGGGEQYGPPCAL